MYYVYCLVSEKRPRFHYYGFTANLEKRMKAHQAGKVRTTHRFAPVVLLGYKEFVSKQEALNFEKVLKSKASMRKSFIAELKLGSPA